MTHGRLLGNALTVMRTKIEGLVARLGRLRELARSQRLRRIALLPAVLVFAGGLVLSIRLLPEQVSLVAPELLLAIVVAGVPLRLAIAAWELKINASLIGASLSWSNSVRTTLFASAANMLPLPGGPLVRATALKLAGGTVVESGAVTALSGLAWLGLAFLAGGYFVVPGSPLIGGMFAAIGGVALVACTYGLYRSKQSSRLIGLLYCAKAAVIAVGVMRLDWAFGSLGIETDVPQLTVFAIANVAGSLIAIAPGGLGVKEAVAAALAPLVGIDPSTAFLAASLNRLVALPVLIAVSLLASSTLAKRADVSRGS